MPWSLPDAPPIFCPRTISTAGSWVAGSRNSPSTSPTVVCDGPPAKLTFPGDSKAGHRGRLDQPAPQRPALRALRFADWYGTTLRVYDPSLRAWRITWRDPSRGVFMDQIARRVGQDIVQEGKGPDGATYRWTFREITTDSFHWTGEIQPPNHTIWTLQVDIAHAASRHPAAPLKTETLALGVCGRFTTERDLSAAARCPARWPCDHCTITCSWEIYCADYTSSVLESTQQ